MPEARESVSAPRARSARPDAGPLDRYAPVPTMATVHALRALPFGGVDDHAVDLDVAPRVRAGIAPLVNMARWSALTYAAVFTADDALAGSDADIVALAVCLFLTAWRTAVPVRLGSSRPVDRGVALIDCSVVGLAVGASAGARSPFVLCLVVAAAVAGFGWGYATALLATAVGWGVLLIGRLAADPSAPPATGAAVLALAGATALVAGTSAFLRYRFQEAADARRRRIGPLDRLTDANDLLTMLNSVARTLPTSLNQRDALDAARQHVLMTFRPSVICLLEYDEAYDEWTPKITEGCAVGPASGVDELPVHLRQAMDGSEPWLVPDLGSGTLPGVAPGSRSGLYTRLVSRGRTVGVLGIEHDRADRFRERDRHLLAGMADVIALNLDNARWFGRLRSLGAEEERVRVARDLHDRIGQWLTYISIELERLISADGADAGQLRPLYDDVQTALGELRETLHQLRSDITEERPLSVVGRELAERFADRTGASVRFDVERPGARLPVRVETELLRIMQEALNNVEKHAAASRVLVRWTAADGRGELAIVDDGRGFDARHVVRDSAYGLVGMRERADVIGGRIVIESAPAHGTTVVVSVGEGPTPKEG